MGGNLPSRSTAHYLLHNLSHLCHPVHNLRIHPLELRVNIIIDPVHMRTVVHDARGHDQPVDHPVLPAILLNKPEQPRPRVVVHVHHGLPAKMGKPVIDILHPVRDIVLPVRWRELQRDSGISLIADEPHVHLDTAENNLVSFERQFHGLVFRRCYNLCHDIPPGSPFVFIIRPS